MKEAAPYLLGLSGSGGGSAERRALEEAGQDVLNGLVLGLAGHDVHVGTTADVEPRVVEMDDGPIVLEEVDLFNACTQ